MSRNLCTSSCVDCGHTFRLSDLRGKPVEFRQYGPYAPVLGVKVVCKCERAYFAAWRYEDTVWDHPSLRDGSWKSPVYMIGSVTLNNRHAGRFAFEDKSGNVYNTGAWSIDLSYYESYNDEPGAPLAPGEDPAHLCLGDALETQNVL